MLIIIGFILLTIGLLLEIKELLPVRVGVILCYIGLFTIIYSLIDVVILIILIIGSMLF